MPSPEYKNSMHIHASHFSSYSLRLQVFSAEACSALAAVTTYLAATVLTFSVKLLFRGVVHSFSKLCMKTQPFLVVQSLVATNNLCHAPKFFSEDRDITLCTTSKPFLILQISTMSLLLLFFVCLFGCVFTCFIIIFFSPQWKVLTYVVVPHMEAIS